MQYTCRVYFNTGFNLVNIPDSPALLNQMSFADAAVLDLNQERVLPYVRVRSDWNTVKNGDYCKVGDFFYFIEDITMTSGDVAELTLTPDYVTSAGGPAALEILDGLTNRVHVSDDTYGIYNGDDPFMAPAYDMDIDSHTQKVVSPNSYTFVETTLNLANLGIQKQTNATPALTAVDPDESSYYVTYPVVEPLNYTTEYTMENVSGNLLSVKGQGLYDISYGTSVAQTIRDGISQARSLGVEEAISGQFAIPAAFVTPNTTSDGLCSGVQGREFNFGLGTAFKYGTAKNNRVFYGSYTPYTLVAASGSSVTVNAEEIYNGQQNPTIKCKADPRRTGKPYYRFEPMNNVSGSGLDFFRNSVAGKPWNNVPLVLTGKSGNLLDRVSFDATQKMEDLNLQQAYNSKVVGNAMGLISSGSNVAGGGNILSQALNAGMTAGVNDFNYDQLKRRMALQRAIETQQFQISQSVVAPSIHFPVEPDLFSELTNNGCAVYRVVYKAADIARIDKILTAYGYKHTKVLETTDFTNRTYFNYVEGSITVGNLPRWWANGISAQIGSGVRVWHVKPNHSYYSNNPVRI